MQLYEPFKFSQLVAVLIAYMETPGTTFTY